MGLPAVKHLDPVVGVDVHSVLVAPSPTPVFLPHPHVGFMLDLREYVEAAKGVVGSIAMALVQEKVGAYLEDHPDVVKKLGDAATFASGKVADIQDNAIVVEGMKLEQQAAALQSSIGSMLGTGVGMGGAAGRPIFVNGLMRATVGTHSFHVPGLHFPLGESFAPPPEPDPIPSDDAESFMGSRTVLANNDPMSFMALPALSCWSVGMEPPGHNSAHTERTYPSMPSSVMLPIPAGRPVMVGGPPVLNMAAAAKGLFKAFQGSKWAKALADKLNLKPGFLRCKVLQAEPVDVTTGEVVVQQTDFTLSGRFPLVWERHYASRNEHAGVAGTGWRTPADVYIEIVRHESRTGAVAYFPDHTTCFDQLPDDVEGPEYTLDWQHGHALYVEDSKLVLRTFNETAYVFALPKHWKIKSDAVGDGDGSVLPVERIVDPDGNAWVFERGPNGGLARVSEWMRGVPTGRKIVCTTRDQSPAFLQSMTLLAVNGKAHPLVGYEHDREGNLVAAIDAMAHQRTFEYEGGHRMIRHTSAGGASFRYRYGQQADNVTRVERAWGEDGLFDYRFLYDLNAMETRVTNSLGHTTVIQLNDRGIPVSELDPLGGMTQYRYDRRGRTCSVVAPSGNATTWEYGDHGNLVAQTMPDGSQLRIEYDENHRPRCITAPGGRQWRYEWDRRGHLLALTAPDQAVSTYEYDESGQVVAHTGPRRVITLFEYDRDGNLAASIDALGHRTKYAHDDRGNLIQVVDAARLERRYEYDRIGNLTRAIEPGGRDVRCEYDRDSNLVSYRDSAGYVTRLEYSKLGQVRRREAPDGTVVEYEYDTEARLCRLINERGEQYRLTRDALGRVLKETDYWDQSYAYEYGVSGHLRQITDPLGRTIIFRADALGRVIRKEVADPRQMEGVRIESFEYDSAGNLIVAQNSDCRVELSYDPVGRVVEERQGNLFTVSFEHDATGNRICRRTRAVIGGRTFERRIRYRYDELDAVSAIQVDDAAPIAFERNSRGQVEVKRFGNDLCNELSYAADGKLARQVWFGGAGVLFNVDYAYDARGFIVEKRDSRLGAEQFEYDPIGHVTSHVDPMLNVHRFLHDPAGDLLKTYAHSTREVRLFGRTTAEESILREGQFDGARYTFDSAGNLLRKQSPEQDLSFVWDAEGLLVETISRTQRNGRATRLRTRYLYDTFHRRIGKETAETDDHGNDMAPGERWMRASRYLWDGDVLAREIACDGNGRVTDAKAVDKAEHVDDREWIYYPNTFHPLALASTRRSPHRMADTPSDDASDLFFYQCDPNGAAIRVVDEHGIIRWEAGYRASGACIPAIEHLDFVQPLRLQGQYFDDETGLHYNRYRYFDPDVGLYVSPDPLGLRAGENLYGLAPNIFAWIDPLGLEDRFPSWMPTRSLYQRQHIIPFSLRNHPIFVRSGVDINAPANMMYLPMFSWVENNPLIGLHRGWTTEHKEYNEMVGIYLDDLDDLARQGGWDRQTIRQEIYGLQSELRRGSRDGRFTCAS